MNASMSVCVNARLFVCQWSRVSVCLCVGVHVSTCFCICKCCCIFVIMYVCVCACVYVYHIFYMRARSFVHGGKYKKCNSDKLINLKLLTSIIWWFWYIILRSWSTFISWNIVFYCFKFKFCRNKQIVIFLNSSKQ